MEGLGKSDSKLKSGIAKPVYASYARSILWASVPNAIAIGLAFKILSLASTKFETTVFALLILLSGEVTWMRISHGTAAIEQAWLTASRHCRLLELLGDPSYTGLSKETTKELLDEQEHVVRKQRLLLTLQSIWSAALTSIALFYLLREVL